MGYQYTNIGVTRTHGDATGVAVMDVGIDRASIDGYATSLGTIISTGVGKEIGMFKIVVKNASAAAQALNGTKVTDLNTGAIVFAGNGTPSQIQAGGVVEAIMKVLAQKVTILAYQVESDTSGQISVMFEQIQAWSASFYGQSGGGNGNTSGMIAPTNDYNLIVADLQTAIQALGTTVGYNVPSSTNGQLDVSGSIVVNAGTTATLAAEAAVTAGQFGSSFKLA